MPDVSSWRSELSQLALVHGSLRLDARVGRLPRTGSSSARDLVDLRFREADGRRARRRFAIPAAQFTPTSRDDGQSAVDLLNAVD